MSFQELKNGDLIPVIEVNPDVLTIIESSTFTIESRTADFIELENSGKGVIFKDKGKEVRALFSENKSVCHRVSNNLLSDIYYFSDMEHFELFIKGLDQKVDKFKDSMMEALKTMWEKIDEKK